ncbi:MAG: hypothetical protein JWN04_5322 [Myxococcaceae bacterium]|nr:hypothetical protein [Myxococcaceae bacterium]
MLALLLGCAGSAKHATVVKPMTPEQTKAFDRGVDFVATLEGLEGRWRNDWDSDLQVRVGNATLIAAVTVTTTRVDTDPSQRVTYRLVAHVDRELVGSDADKELELPSAPNDPGYTSVQDNIARMADKQYLAYVRQAADGLYWHLSPVSPEVTAETESQITRMNRAPQQGGVDRVIVHNN